MSPRPYRGRLAPSPTGYLHLGHARTFWIAQERARAAGGRLILRIEDLDEPRCKPEFRAAIAEDLGWFGFAWQEGPERGGPHAPYEQSGRLDLYRAAFDRLRQAGALYPCRCTRRDIREALAAPHAGDEEPIYPGTCRPPLPTSPGVLSTDPAQPSARNLQPSTSATASSAAPGSDAAPSWRFRVHDGEPVEFADANLGRQQFVAGKDFGDFVVWRHDGLPAYQLACVVDDAAMAITEVVRGADLLVSTARQLLLYRALDFHPPSFFHCPLMLDTEGRRLAKRHDALSLRALRAQGRSPEALRRDWIAASESGAADEII